MLVMERGGECRVEIDLVSVVEMQRENASLLFLG